MTLHPTLSKETLLVPCNVTRGCFPHTDTCLPLSARYHPFLLEKRQLIGRYSLQRNSTHHLGTALIQRMAVFRHSRNGLHQVVCHSELYLDLSDTEYCFSLSFISATVPLDGSGSRFARLMKPTFSVGLDKMLIAPSGYGIALIGPAPDERKMIPSAQWMSLVHEELLTSYQRNAIHP